MKILIVYGSTEGQTRKIAGFVRDEAAKAGHTVTLADATDDPPAPGGNNIVFIAASLHMHKYQASVLHYVKENVEVLNQVKSVFLSVSMSCAADNEEARKGLADCNRDFLAETGWKPVTVELVAGALRYTKYDYFKKLVMWLIAKREGHKTNTHEDYEYTDWERLRVFVAEMLK